MLTSIESRGGRLVADGGAPLFIPRNECLQTVAQESGESVGVLAVCMGGERGSADHNPTTGRVLPRGGVGNVRLGLPSLHAALNLSGSKLPSSFGHENQFLCSYLKF